MPWARVDDTFHSHPKVRKAWRCRASLGLHMLALSYSSQYETEGKLDGEFVEDQLPDAGERSNATAALVRTGLWLKTDHGWEIHDFLKYNPSKEQVAVKRETDRLRKQEERERNG